MMATPVMYLEVNDDAATVSKIMELINEIARRTGHPIPEQEKDIRRGRLCKIPFERLLAKNYTNVVTHKDDPKRKAVVIGVFPQSNDGFEHGGYKFENKNCVSNIDGWTATLEAEIIP